MIAPAPEYQPTEALDRSRDDRTQVLPRANPLISPGASLQPTAFVERTIASHPVVALVSAGVVGISLGWFVKRRLK